MKHILFSLSVLLLISCSIKKEKKSTIPKSIENVEWIPKKENVWVFILSGQSNMAGRGIVEPHDTITNKRILTINSAGRLVYAKEPIHFYEPKSLGLDCGLAFSRKLLKMIPDSISVLIIPTAVGGSSITQWLGDSTFRGVKLLSNFREKVSIGERYGQIKSVLWHQGESDANEKSIPLYAERLSQLVQVFRISIKNDSLPVLFGELGTFSVGIRKINKKLINDAIIAYSLKDNNSSVISTSDLKDIGDKIHFDAKGQRKMGKRFAEQFMKKFGHL